MNQAVLCFENKRAFLFCRGNALYISYYNNDLPQIPSVADSGIKNDFIVIPEEKSFKILYEKENGELKTIRAGEKLIERVNTEKVFTLINKGDIFLSDGKNTVFSDSEEILDFNRKIKISDYDKDSYYRCFYVNNEAMVIFTYKDVFAYSSKRRKVFDVAQNKGKLIDTSVCACGDKTYIVLLFKNNNVFETVLKIIDENGGAKASVLIKTNNAENVFACVMGDELRVMTTQQNGVVFYRQANLKNMIFSDIHQFKMENSGKAVCFCTENMKVSYSDVWCRNDGKILYPEMEIIKAKENENAEIISKFNAKLNEMQMKMNQSINMMENRLKRQIEINNELRNENMRLKNKYETDNTDEYTIYMTRSKVIE